MIKKEFKQFFSFEQFKAVTQDDAKFETLYESIDSFLQENNIAKAFKNHETYQTNFGYHWEKYLENTCNSHEKVEMFRALILRTILMMNGNENGDKAKKIQQYEQLNNKLNQGNFSTFDLGEAYDFNSGKNLHVEIKNWQPVLMEYVENPQQPYRGTYVEVKPQQIEHVLDCTIEFKTGELLVSDWFRIQEFNDLVDSNYCFDVNSEKGRLEQSKFYFEKFNFICNTSWADSTVFKNGDDLLFIEDDDDLELPSTFKRKGKVYKQLRALTIIEKQQLINLLGNEELVNDYLEDNTDVLKLKIKPGTYSFRLTSSPDLQKIENPNIDNRHEQDDVINKLMNDENFSPILILRKVKHNLNNKPKMKKS